jgi:serine phosphatase RsbU (regulator of sigma subunit)
MITRVSRRQARLPGQAALVVGDVTGHSIHAAAIMGQLRTTTAADLGAGTSLKSPIALGLTGSRGAATE